MSMASLHRGELTALLFLPRLTLRAFSTPLAPFGLGVGELLTAHFFRSTGRILTER